ncbi:MAG: DUF4382 domain-containing protein [Burkholderiales bacterium]|jgi:hypothetical protein
MKKIFYGALLLAASMVLSSCGGGGDGGSSTGASTAPATVGLVFTDASSDDWDKALATITSVTLIGDAGQQQIFSGEKEVDLFTLREHVKLFLVKHGVNPGYYSKIRLQVKKLVLVKENDGAPDTLQDVKVPSGKIDLNPRDTFYIGPGTTIFVSLDWDMEKSLKLTETGSGKWIMRPVIFVHIGTKPLFKQGLVRLSGVVQAVGDLGFRLCSTPTPTPAATASASEEFCVNVLVKSNTGVFDSSGQPRTDQAVTVGEELTVLGLLRRTEDDHDDYDDDDDDDYEYHDHPSAFSKDDDGDDDDDGYPKFLISAIVVEVGQEGTWDRIRGVLTTAVDSVTKQFSLDPDAGQGYDDATVLTAQLFDQSRIFQLAENGSIKEITPGDLLVGDTAAMDAVKLDPPGGSGQDLNVAVMLARPTAVTETLTGTITSVSVLGDSMGIDGGTTCVTTNNLTTRTYLLTDSGVTEINVTDLPIGGQAVVTAPRRDPPGIGCLDADVIVATPPSS